VCRIQDHRWPLVTIVWVAIVVPAALQRRTTHPPSRRPSTKLPPLPLDPRSSARTASDRPQSHCFDVHNATMTSTLADCIVAVSDATANQSPIYRRASSKDGFPGLSKNGVAITTLYEMFTQSALSHPDLPALGHRPILVSTERRPPPSTWFSSHCSCMLHGLPARSGSVTRNWQWP